MSQRLWAPLHDWLGKLGLCKPFCLSKIQCSKLKSQVSLCSGMSHLGREEAERRFFSFTTWRFLKCHNQRFSHTLLFHSNYFYHALFFIFPILLFFPSFFFIPVSLLFPPLFGKLLFAKCYTQSSSFWHMRLVFNIFEKPDLAGWQTKGKQESWNCPARKTSLDINL